MAFLLLGFFCGKKVTMKLKLPKAAEQDGIWKGKLQIVNDSVLPVFLGKGSLHLENHFTGEQMELPFSFSLKGRGKKAIDFQGKSQWCGCIYATLHSWRSYDFFGLAGQKRKAGLSLSLIHISMLYYVESSGNWITLESLVYGIVLGAVMFVVIQWFSCYNKIMTTDKFVYLFGKLIPALSLILSMALRFVPSFLGQLKFIRNGQKAMGKDISEGKLLDRIHAGLNMLSILITWALENAIETSDSMRSRGYGLKGRTAFSIYHFTRKDKYVFGIMIGLFTVFTGGCMRGASYATYDPRIILAGFSINGYEAPVVASKAWTILTYVSFGIFCFLPIIIDVIESVSFSHSRRKSAVNLEMTYKKIYETLEEKGTVL